MNKDSLGDRMKQGYEDAYRIFLPTRSNVILRLDGKAFRSYTKHFQKPYDDRLISIFDRVGLTLARNLMNVQLIYLQSDEINIWMNNCATVQTEPWFNNNLQKMVSVSASIATAKFNQIRILDEIFYKMGNHFCEEINLGDIPLAHFDSRAFIIPELIEVANFFLWRCKDWSRNSIQMLARSFYSHKELGGGKYIPIA